MTDEGMSMRGCRPITDWEPSGEERDAAERAVAKIRITDEGLPTLDDLDGEELYMLHLWLEELALDPPGDPRARRGRLETAVGVGAVGQRDEGAEDVLALDGHVGLT